MTTTKLGTPLTMSPELLMDKGEYTSKTDLWSIGIVIYQILYGAPPFFAETQYGLLKVIQQQSGDNLCFPFEVTVSQDAKDLITGLLQYDEKRRLDWKQLFSHKFL